MVVISKQQAVTCWLELAGQLSQSSSSTNFVATQLSLKQNFRAAPHLTASPCRPTLSGDNVDRLFGEEDRQQPTPAISMKWLVSADNVGHVSSPTQQ